MHICHSAMQPYLEDLESRLGLPVRYQRWSSRYMGKAPFRHEINVVGPHSGTPATYSLPYKNDVREVEVVSNRPDTGEPLELAVDGSHYHVASVDGRRVRLVFDLERLFEQPPEDLHPGLVLDAVLGAACLKAATFVKEYRWEDETERFLTWNVEGVAGQITAWKQNIRDNEHELDRLVSTTAKLVRKNTELRDQCKAASTTTRTDCEAQAKSEFASLTKLVPTVAAQIDFDSARLVVVLQPLTVEHDGCDYELGSFTLQIAPDNMRIWSDAGLRYPHPHVSSDGVPCWGNLGPHVARLLGERAYASLVAATVEFLKSYNERDAYRRIETWDPDWSDDE